MRYVCLLCDRVFDSLGEVNSHLREFHRVKPIEENTIDWRYVYPENIEEKLKMFLEKAGYEVYDVRRDKFGFLNTQVFFDGLRDLEKVGKEIDDLVRMGFYLREIHTGWVTIQYMDYHGIIVSFWITYEKVIELLEGGK